MTLLSDEQHDSLLRFRGMVTLAIAELSDSISTGLMSDSKTAVYNVIQAADELVLPDELNHQLQSLVHSAWHGVAAGDGISSDVYTRAAVAIQELGKLDRMIEANL